MEQNLENQECKQIAIVNEQEYHVFREGYRENCKAHVLIPEISIALMPGYKFFPSDEELIVHFLKKKVSDEPVPINRIRNVNLYLFNPQQLSELYKVDGEEALYFFIPRDPKYNGTQLNRAAGDGYWTDIGEDTIIYSGSQPVGFRKTLVFFEGKLGHGMRTIWSMHEFSVYPNSARNDLKKPPQPASIA
ncbi:hypothetical protein L1049_008550 [Liquidambar formosana]|uniref:NAC domain-containing protein n=1 Tax=Liquidambar formosana TaxID=63359 RepID=A0AAP0X4N4_LIQFO